MTKVMVAVVCRFSTLPNRVLEEGKRSEGGEREVRRRGRRWRGKGRGREERREWIVRRRDGGWREGDSNSPCAERAVTCITLISSV